MKQEIIIKTAAKIQLHYFKNCTYFFIRLNNYDKYPDNIFGEHGLQQEHRTFESFTVTQSDFEFIKLRLIALVCEHSILVEKYLDFLSKTESWENNNFYLVKYKYDKETYYSENLNEYVLESDEEYWENNSNQDKKLHEDLPYYSDWITSNDFIESHLEGYLNWILKQK